MKENLSCAFVYNVHDSSVTFAILNMKGDSIVNDNRGFPNACI